MKATPGTLQQGGASFATTHWSVVAQSAITDVPEAANALAQLCESYWSPIYSFIRRRGYPPADAEDLTQSFFAFFLRTKAYARTDRLHGKFRSFLLASLKNFLADNWDRKQAIRRGGGYQFIPLDPEKAEAFYDAVSAPDSTAECLFELRHETDRFDRTLSKTVDHVQRSVRYDQVNAMLLNEFLKEHREVQELQATVAQQQKSFQSKLDAKQIAVLTSGLRKIDAQFELREPEQQLVFKKHRTQVCDNP